MWGPPRGGAGVLFNYNSEEAPVGFLVGFGFRLGEFGQPAPELVLGGIEYLSSFLKFELPNGPFELLDRRLELRPAGAAVYLTVRSCGL